MEKYENLIKYFVSAYKNSDDINMQNEARNVIKFTVEAMYKANYKTKEECIKILAKVGLSEKEIDFEHMIKSAEPVAVEIPREVAEVAPTEKVVSKTDSISDNSTVIEEDEYAEAKEYIDEVINKNPELKEEFDKLIEQLDSDMENPSYELMETWLKNYNSFINDNELDKEKLTFYVEYLFKNKYEDMEFLEQFMTEYKEKKEKRESEITPESEKKAPTEVGEASVQGNSSEEEKTSTTEVVETTTQKGESDIPKEETEIPSEKQVEDIPETSEVEEGKKTELAKPEPKKIPIMIDRKPLKIVSLKKPEKTFWGKVITRGAGVATVLSILSVSNVGLVVGGVTWAASLIARAIKEGKYKHNDLYEVLNKYNLDVKTVPSKETPGKYEHHVVEITDGKEVGVDKEADKKRYAQIKDALVEIGAVEQTLSERIPARYKQSSLLSKMKGLVTGFKERLRLDKEEKSKIAESPYLRERESIKEEYKIARSNLSGVLEEPDEIEETEEKGRRL